MVRHLTAPATLALCAALALGSPGCGNIEPSDEPLPSFEELRAEFGGQPAGRGVVVEGENGGGDRFPAAAEHNTTGEGELARLRVNLLGADPAVALVVFVDGERAAALRPGAEFEDAQFLYGRGDGSGGSGRLEITSVGEGRIEGVFAADLVPNGLVPDFRRVRGGFHAVPRPAGADEPGARGE